MSDERSVWLRVTVVDTDVWTSDVGSPITTFETPCGETFRVFSEGLEIVPVSPVRADREAVVEAAQAVLEASIPIIGEDAAHVPNAALTALESALDALRATPEPERVGE